MHPSHVVLLGKQRQIPQQPTTSHVPATVDCSFDVVLSNFSGRKWIRAVRSSYSVLHLKTIVQQYEGIPSDRLILWLAGRTLKDHLTLADYNIQAGSCIFYVDKNAIEAGTELADYWDSKFDYDFTNEKDDGRVFVRGGEVYHRPYGWKRLGLRVKGLYGSDGWLGENGVITISSCKGEWPVSYHGTSGDNAMVIAERGYDLRKGKRFTFGRGIYTTPDPKVAERYATKYERDGKTYLLVVQNRVNPLTLKKIVGRDTGVGEYWLSPSQADVRPYGIIYKEVSRY